MRGEPLTATMWAVQFHRNGEPDAVLDEVQTAVPEPGESQVRVRVLAVDLNPADLELCRRFRPDSLPCGIGLDVAGVVEAVGAGVTGTSVGDRVFGTPAFATQASAGLATSAVLDLWFPLTEGLSEQLAAALIMPIRTAVWTLDAMGVGPGTHVLIHGGGSTIGHAMVQIATRRGADVVTTAGPTHDAALASFGARVTRYGPGLVDRVRAITQEPFDVVIDAGPVDERSLPPLLDLVDEPGRVFTISNHAQGLALGVGCNPAAQGRALTPVPDIVAEWAPLVAAGDFVLPIGYAGPMANWRDAMAASVAGAVRGKIVLTAGTGLSGVDA